MVKSGTIRLRVNPGVSRIFQTNTFFPNFHLWRFADLPLTIQTRPLLLRTGRLSIVLENLFVLQEKRVDLSLPSPWKVKKFQLIQKEMPLCRNCGERCAGEPGKTGAGQQVCRGHQHPRGLRQHQEEQGSIQKAPGIQAPHTAWQIRLL